MPRRTKPLPKFLEINLAPVPPNISLIESLTRLCEATRNHPQCNLPVLEMAGLIEQSQIEVDENE